MLRGQGCEPHVAVDAAEEGEVGRQWGNVLTPVVRADGEAVRSPEVQVGGEVESAGGVAPGVLAGAVPVHVHGCSLAHAL